MIGMNFGFLFSFGLLSNINGFEINDKSVLHRRYNESCDALDNRKLCEDECDSIFRSCIGECETQGQC